MSYPRHSVEYMTPDLNSLLSEASHLNVEVEFVNFLPTNRRGGYIHSRRLIVLNSGLSERMNIPALMHELEHARREDDGHQHRWIERCIDRTVSRNLITPSQYAEAENAVGPHVGAIAAYLQWPCYVVEAYQDVLRCSLRR